MHTPFVILGEFDKNAWTFHNTIQYSISQSRPLVKYGRSKTSLTR